MATSESSSGRLAALAAFNRDRVMTGRPPPLPLTSASGRALRSDRSTDKACSGIAALAATLSDCTRPEPGMVTSSSQALSVVAGTGLPGMIGEHHAFEAEEGGSAGNGAEIVRIADAVEQEQEAGRSRPNARIWPDRASAP